MKSIVITVLTSIGSQLVSILSRFFLAAREFFKYLNYRREKEIQEKKEKEAKEYNEKLKDVVDNGNVEDLLAL